MTKKRFLEIMDEIDDDLIENYLEIPAEEKNPQKIYLSENHTPFWKPAAASAAIICVIMTGVFALVKIRGIPHTEPNDSAVSYSENSPASSGSFQSKSERAVSEGAEFEFTIEVVDGKSYYTEPVEKTDDENFAAVYLEGCRNISEENPLFIGVYVTRERGKERVAEITVIQNDNQVIQIPYKAVKGEKYALGFVSKNKVMLVSGRWLP